MLNLVLFGPPGAGKGTQSENLVKHYGILHLSTGEVIRAEIAKQTKIGLQIQSVIEHGNLAPDNLVEEIIRNWIKENRQAKGFLFDGYPRTEPQAEHLEDILKDENLKLTRMLSLELPQDVLMQRLLERGKISGRSDDKEDVILNRFKEYEEKTAAVAKFYQAKNLYSKIDGLGSVDEVFSRLKAEIDRCLD